MGKLSFYRMAAGLCLLVSLALFNLSGAVSADSRAGNGLKVSPVTTNLSANPGETKKVQMNVENVTQAPIELQVIVNDFTAGNNESGMPALLLDPGQYAPAHSLKRFIAPIGNISLQAGEKRTITITIVVPKNAPGGGYYGAVRFEPVSPNGDSNVTLSASVGSLILVRVPGNVKEQLKLDSFDVRDGEDNSPKVIFTTGNGLVAAARFENVGDVQEQPFGKVVLKQGSKQLAVYEMNDTIPAGNVLPDSIRRFTVKLDKVGAFGKYTISGNFGYGSNGQLLSAETTFYVVPLQAIILGLAAVILVLFFIFVLPRLIRSYNRRIIERARR